MSDEFVYAECFVLASSQIGLIEFIRSMSGPGLSGTKKWSGTRKVLHISNDNAWERKKNNWKSLLPKYMSEKIKLSSSHWLRLKAKDRGKKKRIKNPSSDFRELLGRGDMSSTTLRLTKRCQFRGTLPQTSISIKPCNMRKELAEKGCLVPLQGLGRGALYCLILEEFLSLTPKKKRFVKSESVSNMRWLVCHSMVEYLLHQKTSIGLLDAVETKTGERWHSGWPPAMSEDRIAILCS